MDRKSINLNNLENFLEKAKNKLNEGIEDIGQNNMNKLDEFLSEIRNEKINKINITSNDICSQSKNLSEIKIDENSIFNIEKFRESNQLKINNQGIIIYYDYN